MKILVFSDLFTRSIKLHLKKNPAGLTAEQLSGLLRSQSVPAEIFNEFLARFLQEGIGVNWTFNEAGKTFHLRIARLDPAQWN